MARLNAQGLARREPLLMRCIESDPGMVTVSMDLAAGEPACSSHYSGDANYRYATLDGVGQRPYYDSEGTLKISDIYLTVMSRSPLGKEELRKAFDTSWPAGSFADQWIADSEVITKKLKSSRQLHKILCLGLGYGMQPRKLVNTAYEAGYVITFKQAKEFFNVYWSLFAQVRELADRLEQQVRIEGSLINEFGYRLVPDPRKGFNYWIQSSVSGIVHILGAKLFALAPYAQFITVIHDEILAQVPADKVEDFRQAKEAAVKSLNEDLNWTVQIRVGFAVGETWFEAK
jgi:hypothetical protein